MYKYFRAIGFTFQSDYEVYEYFQNYIEENSTEVKKDIFSKNFNNKYGFMSIISLYKKPKIIYIYPQAQGIKSIKTNNIEFVEKIDGYGVYGIISLYENIKFFVNNFYQIENVLKGKNLKLIALGYIGRVILPKKEKNDNKIEIKTRDIDINKEYYQSDSSRKYSTNVILNDKFYLEEESYFMSIGFEPDKYRIMANIIELEEEVNELTKEKFYIFTVEIKKIFLKLYINKKDLRGIPRVGMRIKALVWLQGEIIKK